MRVVSRMRTVAPRAIVAASVIVAGCALSGCGQRGPLYMPTVPPLPAKPVDPTQTPSTEAVKPDSQAASGTIPDTSGTPLTLSPETELRTVPDSAASAPQPPASDSTPVQ
ncbi:MAG: lipoprotein [Pseudomonadota bacterium]|uniref:LPS translocon maturation chaperone LptM n=1 Tax=Burkholderiaceae TaxID=119060 RepID=UPI0010F5003A|nr:lipoprotein [Burkholderia sp. 4M9327F10]